MKNQAKTAKELSSQPAESQATPDALAYLALAAKELATEQEFQPTTAEEFHAWIAANATAIADRASRKQAALLNTLFAPRNERAFKALRSTLCAKVWARVNHHRIDTEANNLIHAALVEAQQ